MCGGGSQAETGMIYYVLDAVLFPTQIVVIKELDRKNHMWLSELSEGMGKQDMKELLERIRQGESSGNGTLPYFIYRI